MFHFVNLPLLVVALVGGVSRADSPKLYEFLPATSQAMVWIPNASDLSDRWEQTLLHQLAEDPTVAPFFKEQREMIQNRLMEAGWRLGVKPQELMDYFPGQLSVAWLEMPNERKPFALVMLGQVVQQDEVVGKLMSEIETAIAKHNPVKKQLSHMDQTITQYTLPRREGQLLDENTLIAAVSGTLIATDDLPVMHQMIEQLTGQASSQVKLVDDKDFIASREQLKITGQGHIEYFVRPLGIARVVRAISGKKSKSNADILEVFRNQGFTAIKCVSGEIQVRQGDVDIAHRGFVLAEHPLPRSAAVLDFPNKALSEIPSFVSNRVDSFMTVNWNAQTAFWKVRELVDELVGNQGVFDEVINGIKNDANGPKVDIRNEFLPLLTNDIIALTDTRDGEIDVDSRRNLIALKVNQPAKAASILDRVMKAEANAEMLEFDGVTIWKVTNEAEDVQEDFSEFGFDDEQEEEEEPWLNQWAISVLQGDTGQGASEGYFMFASHTEMIEQAITQARSGGADHLASEADYQRMHQAISQLMNDQNPCAWKVSRNHKAHRVQYELFRQGKLQDSESMLATLMNRFVEVDAEATAGAEGQKVDGKDLPPFDTITKFLQPSGFKVVSTPHGWEFGSLLLGDPNRGPTELSSGREAETARIVDSAGESKR
jgi:hypothetical protein